MKKIISKLSCIIAASTFGLFANSAIAAEQSWVDLAVHNFGAPINTMWAEGELSFAEDGTMVYCSASPIFAK